MKKVIKKDDFSGLWMEYYKCLQCGSTFLYPSNMESVCCCWCLNVDRVKMKLMDRKPGSFAQNDLWERDINLGTMNIVREIYLSNRKDILNKKMNAYLKELSVRQKIKEFWKSNPHPTEEEYDKFFYQKDIVKYCLAPTTTDKRYISSMKNS